MVGVAGEAFGPNVEFARQIVETRDMQADAAHAGQVALTRLSAPPASNAPCSAIAWAAYSMPLAAPRRPSARSGLAGIGMADGAAGNDVFRPVDHGIEQAHAALVRDAGGDGGVV
jgi:hypothetical protein